MLKVLSLLSDVLRTAMKNKPANTKICFHFIHRWRYERVGGYVGERVGGYVGERMDLSLN
jgi:hypothetical protein